MSSKCSPPLRSIIPKRAKIIGRMYITLPIKKSKNFLSVSPTEPALPEKEKTKIIAKRKDKEANKYLFVFSGNLKLNFLTEIFFLLSSFLP